MTPDGLARRSLPRVALAVVAIAAVVAIVLMVDAGGTEKTDSPMVCADDAASVASPLLSQRMHDVALVGMDRRPVMLSELGGKRFTVAVFCSYQCPCSDGYVDRLRDLRRRYESRGVAFIAIHSSADERIDGMLDYIKRKEYPLPVYRDDMGTVADELQATVTPEAFVFDSAWTLRYQGRIDDDKSGLMVEEESLRLALDTLLSGEKLQVSEKASLGCAIVRAADGREQ